MREYRVTLNLLGTIRKGPPPTVQLIAESEMRAVALALAEFRRQGKNLGEPLEVGVHELPDRTHYVHSKGTIAAWLAMPHNAQFIAANNLGSLLPQLQTRRL